MAQQLPRYQQIADDLRRRIESREFTPDVTLPTEVELQDQYRASRNTVREAVKLLVQQHLVETRAGQGTFAAREIVAFVTTLSTDPQAGFTSGEKGAPYPAAAHAPGRRAGDGTPWVTVLKCPPHIAARLRIAEDKRVVSRCQERFIDGAIWSLQTSYYPLEWVQKGAVELLEPENIGAGTAVYLAETIGLKQVGYRDLISARIPNEREQTLFNLTHNHTVIEVYRTSFAEDGTPIRVTVTVFPSDRNQIAYDLGTVPERQEEPVRS